MTQAAGGGGDLEGAAIEHLGAGSVAGALGLLGGDGEPSLRVGGLIAVVEFAEAFGDAAALGSGFEGKFGPGVDDLTEHLQRAGVVVEGLHGPSQTALALGEVFGLVGGAASGVGARSAAGMTSSGPFQSRRPPRK